MKIARTLVTLVLLSSPAMAEVSVGTAAPDFTLNDADGKATTLSAFKGKVVVLEWVNPNCPFVRRHTKEKTMSTVRGKHPDVVWLSINSTAAGTPEAMAPVDCKKWAADNGIAYPMLFDGDGRVGKAYGAKTTPHMFVIGTDGTLLYTGAIDDDPPGGKAASERENYVDDALTAIAKGEKVAMPATKSYGCSVKYAQ
ncbi:MAG: redoxin domain-containing protein [Acidobacteriota bacterium]